MEFDEMNRRACRRELCPDGLTPAEKTAYLTLRLLYELVGRKPPEMTRETAVNIKNQVAIDLARNRGREHESIRNATIVKQLRRSVNPEVRAAVRAAEQNL